MYAVASAPGRVNLIGEHTDYSGGLVLPFAIDARVQVRVETRPDDLLHVRSAQQPGGPVDVKVGELRPGRPAGWAGYVAGVCWALREEGIALPGLDVTIDSAIPIGAGLSSSAALSCAVAVAVTAVIDVTRTATELARLARRAENDFVGVPSGPMDQIAVMCARTDHALLLDTRTLATEQVALRPREHDLELLVVDSGERHQLTDGSYADRRRQVEQASTALGVSALRDVHVDDLPAARRQLGDDVLFRRVRHVVTENRRVRDTVALLRAGGLAGIGPLLTASHASLRDDFQVSTPAIDRIVESSLAAGAVGARLTGAGFGGSVIVLSPIAHRPGIVEALTGAADAAGHPTPTVRAVTPCDGAAVRRPSS